MAKNSVLRLRSRPQGRIQNSDLEVCQEEMPQIEDGEVLVKNLYVSLDPTHRIWMSDIPQYMPAVELGECMRAATVGVVHTSKNDDYPVGTFVVAMGGVCEYFKGVIGENVYYPIDTSKGLPLTAYLSVNSIIIGLTAWYGTNKVLEVKKDDVVVISGASGAVGSLVGQLSKLKGAYVIGIAGGDMKCKRLLNEFGFDYAIDYKSQDVDAELKKAAPKGITCYFDNVGGKITDSVLQNYQNYGRFAFCGSISEYEDNWSGLKNWNMILMRRLMVKGFICIDHMDHLQESSEELSQLVADGKLKYSEDVRKVGLDGYVNTLNDLFDGKNTGKLIMQLDEDPNEGLVSKVKGLISK